MKVFLLMLALQFAPQNVQAEEAFKLTWVNDHISSVKDGNVTCYILQRVETGGLSCVGQPEAYQYSDKGSSWSDKFYRQVVNGDLCYVFNYLSKAGIHCYKALEEQE